MREWMTEFRKFLVYETKYPQLVGEEDDEKPALLHKVQAAICQNINLYTEKYEEEFSPYLQYFVQDVWALLMKMGSDARYDLLVTSAIHFLTSLSLGVHYELFKDSDTLKMLVERIIIPNMKLREIDVELFEDNPTEYIRRDMEGSDSDTRRKASLELVKGLRKHYERAITEICSTYINALLQQYATNPAGAWQAKDVAIFLVTALAVRSLTSSQGTTQVSEFVPLLDFFATQILPELQSDTSPALVLKADSLKFVLTFRQQLPKEAYLTLFPLFLKNLLSVNVVIHTYSASCIEKLLLVKDKDQGQQPVSRFGKDDLKPFLEVLLANLFKALESEASRENDYVMKAGSCNQQCTRRDDSSLC